MKRILFLLLFLSAQPLLMAAPVGMKQALKEANKFLSSTVTSKLKRQVPRNRLTLAYIASQGNDSTLYIFNREDNAGYVVVSGDDRTVPVLGYAEHGSFSLANAPANLKAWLKGYERQIGYLLSHPELQNNVRNVESSKSVEPLLGDIAWGQFDPYNRKCPTDCPTGCIATAMGQVMYYHRWPATYDWNAMTPTLTDSSSNAAIEAVSALLYQTGVSVDTKYSTEVSYAYRKEIAPALVRDFGYDKTCALLWRDYYTTNEWEQIVRDELDAKRVVLYGGYMYYNYDYSGHMFVCDGYDTNGYFHINWGWDGDYNGYFLLSALNPLYPATADVATPGYCFDQGIIVGIQKPVPGSKPVVMLDYVSVANTTFTVDRTDSVTLVATEVYNDGSFDVLAHLRFNVYDKDSNLVAFSTVFVDSLRTAECFDTVAVRFAVPTALADGTYKAVLAAHVPGIDEDGVFTNLRHLQGNNYYYAIQVKDGKATYAAENASRQGPMLYLKGQLAIDASDVKNVKATAVVLNAGGDYKGKMRVDIYPKGTNSPIASIGEAMVDLEAGEEDTLTFAGDLSDVLTIGAEYTAEIVYYDSETEDWGDSDSWKSYEDNPLYADVDFTAPTPTGLSIVDTGEAYDVVDVFLLTGQRVARYCHAGMAEVKESLAHGHYIVRCGKDGVTYTLRVVK